MSSMYKGLAVPDYTDSADAPLAFQQLIDSGPVPRFANATARNAAIPAPVLGQVAYRLDTKVIEVYGPGPGTSANAWRSVNPLVPPAHTHQSADIVSLNGAKLTDNSVAVSGASDKLTGVIANVHLPNASATVEGVLKVTPELDDASNLKALASSAAGKLVAKTLTALQTMAGPLKLPNGSATAPALRVGSWGGGVYADTINAIEMTTGPGGVNFRLSGEAPGFLPGVDNQLHLGGSSFRFRDVYAVDGSINTSDPSKKVIEGRIGGGVLKMIQDVMPIRFRWIEGDDGIHYGFDASEVEVVIPTVVKGEPGNRGIRERDLIALLWAAVRELDRRTADGTA